MAINESRLRVAEFDFDEVKDNFKTFLKAQTQFTDYDFEGSGMNILLDVLAYNTHYLGFNANMLANEMFLDSASIRSSVTSHAKTLGYIPTSARASKATVDVILNTSISSVTMPAGTVFTSTVDAVRYQFVTIADVTKSNIGTGIPFLNTDIYEGTYVTTRYIVDSSDVDQRFLLTDNRADTSTLIVQVQNSVSDSTTATYTHATDISQLSDTSTVYFLQEVDAGRFEVYFGDDVIGKKLTDNNIVLLTYVVSNKAAANAASSFTNTGAIGTVTNVSVATVSASSGGREAETIASIKYNAPLDYASQGRCVTAEDYKVYAKNLFRNTQSVQVWGGDSGSFDTSLGVVDTAEFGKVFISIKSTTGQILTDTEKTQLVTDLSPYTVASITPVIVDPETTTLILTVRFKFDSSRTTSLVSELETLVQNELVTYNINNLNQFDGIFRHSKVTGIVDNADSSILSNVTTVVLGKKFTPITSATTSYVISFNNKIYHPYSGYNATSGGVVSSTGFYISGDTTNEMYFNDDGAGNLRLYYITAGTIYYQDKTAGTVDYSTGKITINGIYITTISNVDGATSTRIRMTIVPDSTDVVPVRNQLLDIDFTNISIVGESDTIATGDSGAGSTYVTSTSYPTGSAY